MKFNKPQLTNILALSGLLFTTARMIRGTDKLYVFALISFAGVWALNYRILWDLKFQKIMLWFLPFGIWAALSTMWSLEPIVSFSRGVFYIFISSTAVLVGFIYKQRLKELFTIITILNVLFIITSFVSFVSGIPNDAWTANHGMGFTSIFTHQNTLAAVLMFTIIGPVYYLLNNVPFWRLLSLSKYKPASPAYFTGESRRANSLDSRFRENVKQKTRHSDDLPAEAGGQNLKEDADIHQHDKQEARHSEFISESKDSKFQRSVSKKGSIIPARLLSLSKYKPESRSNRDAGIKNQTGMTRHSVIPEWFNRESIFSFLLILSNLYFIYLSYSRAVMLVLFIGGLAFIYLLGTIKFNLLFTLVILLLGTSIFYLFQEDISRYLKKGNVEYLANRKILWQPSYQAALNGGVFGLGYGVTDPTVVSNYKKENKFGELKREKGNSILALVEEVGVIGLFLFCVPLIYGYLSFRAPIRNLNLSFNNNHSPLSPLSIFSSSAFYLLPFPFLIVFFVHAQFEAWLVGPSSLFLFVFTLLLSQLLNLSAIE